MVAREWLLTPLFLLPDRTVSVLLNGGEFVCFTMEDAVREVPGQPVEQWKVPGETAIPSGVYRFLLASSLKFGPDTPTIKDVPGFTGIRMHAMSNSDLLSHRSSAGCPIVGMRLAWLSPSDLRVTDDEAALYQVKRRLRSSGEGRLTVSREAKIG